MDSTASRARTDERERPAATPAAELARVWRRRVCCSTARRAVAALLLLLGMLTIPVNCAVAAGPHSIFVPAAKIAAQQHAAHRHHLQLNGPATGAAERLGEVRELHAPGANVPVADSLPTPATALTVLVAVTSDDAIAALPPVEAVLPSEPAAPPACHARLDVPPPRA